MADAIWKRSDDLKLRTAVGTRLPWDMVAYEVGMPEVLCRDRAQYLGLLRKVKDGRKVALHEAQALPLPAGYPVSWGAIVRGTVLDGVQFPAHPGWFGGFKGDR